MHDVFISYSSVNKAIAEAACTRLEAGGAKCWIAPRDVTPGKLWSAEIVEAIAASRMFVLILSDTSNASSDVAHEVEIAARYSVRIIPFRVDNVPLSKSLEYFVSDRHWLDATEPPLGQHLDKLAAVVCAELATPRPASPTPSLPPDRESGAPPAAPPQARSPGIRGSVLALRSHARLVALVSAALVLATTLVLGRQYGSAAPVSKVVITRLLGAAVRTEPSQEASIRTVAGCGAALEWVSDPNQGWYRVRFNGAEGWVGQRRAEPGSQIATGTCAGAPSTPWQMGQTVTAQSMACPGPQPGESGDECVPKGHQFQLTNGPVEVGGEDWFKLQSSSSQDPVGWVKASLLARR